MTIKTAIRSLTLGGILWAIIASEAAVAEVLETRSVPVVVTRLTRLYSPASPPILPSGTLQKDPLGHLVALQKQNWAPAWVTSGFYDWRTVSKYRRRAGLHLGYDIAMPFGSPVAAGWPGTVTAIIPWTASQYGVTIQSPDGTEVTYGHISPTVSLGQSISTGQTVGRIAADHVDVKMRDAYGQYVPFGKGAAPKLSYPLAPRASRNSILTAWLVAKSSKEQAEEDLFLAQNASKKWSLEERSALRQVELLERTLKQLQSAQVEGLISRKRLEQFKMEKSHCPATP